MACEEMLQLWRSSHLRRQLQRWLMMKVAQIVLLAATD